MNHKTHGSIDHVDVLVGAQHAAPHFEESCK